jgi:aspartate aminotransferase
VPARASELQRAGHDVVNLCIGQPDFQTPDHIIEAGRKALADGHHGYTLANGILPLREVVVYRRHRVSPSPAQVLVVPGRKVTMFSAIMMFGEEGTEIIYPNPASQPTRA